MSKSEATVPVSLSEDVSWDALQFDQKLQELFQPVCRQALLKVPELRSVLISFDFKGKLNDVDGVGKGIWLSDMGAADRSPAAVMGTLNVLLQNMAVVWQAANELRADMNSEIVKTVQTMVRQQETRREESE